MVDHRTTDPLFEDLLSEGDRDFRAEVRSWLERNLAKLAGVELPSSPGGDLAEDQILREWQADLASGGFVGISWPVEYGGRGATLLQEVVFERELAAAHAPPILNVVGTGIVGPSLIAFGTDDQRRRLLHPILDASEVWCQGFSEPDAGSDLASLTTRATKTDGGWIINGVKVWTSFAHLARRCILLARTGPPGGRQAGLTVFLMDMDQDGVEVVPIPAMDGRRKLNYLRLDGAFVSDEDVLGAVDDGWSMALKVLAQERMSVGRLVFELPGQLERLRNLAHETIEAVSGGAAYVASVRDDAESRLLDFDGEVQAALLQYYRILEEQSRTGSAGPAGSAAKLVCSELSRRMYAYAVELMTLAGQLAQPCHGVRDRRHQEYWTSFSKTLLGGTSEIQRNIVAERILGLPRDVRPMSRERN